MSTVPEQTENWSQHFHQRRSQNLKIVNQKTEY